MMITRSSSVSEAMQQRADTAVSAATMTDDITRSRRWRRNFDHATVDNLQAKRQASASSQDDRE